MGLGLTRVGWLERNGSSQPQRQLSVFLTGVSPPQNLREGGGVGVGATLGSKIKVPSVDNIKRSELSFQSLEYVRM